MPQRDFVYDAEHGQKRRMNLSLELLAAANRADEPGNWLASALPAIAADLAAGYVALAVADGGRWNALAEAGPARSLPVELLAEVLDREVARSQGNWVAGPLASRAVSGRGPGRLLAECPAAGCPGVGGVVAAGGPRGPCFGPRAASATASESAAWRRSWKLPASGTRRGRSSRCWFRWPRRPRDLLKADRASIFLWDRANHCLIGRPALGVKGGELRVADDRGVVGRVLQSGQPVRVDSAAQPEAIDHSVDTQTALSHAHAARVFPCKRGRASDSACSN